MKLLAISTMSIIKSLVRTILSKKQWRQLHTLKEEIIRVFYILICLRNKLFFMKSLLRNEKLHLGCGDVRIKGYINIDARATKSCDLAHDCSNLNFIHSNSISCVFADAFFEHLYRKKRLSFLKSVNRILKSDGMAIIIGIPDFEIVARGYLEHKKNIRSKVFDLNEVYRYTHGDPEQHPNWWSAQLHKSLFDSHTIANLLNLAGFKSINIFRYCFVGEKLPVSLGFIAYKNFYRKALNKKNIRNILSFYPTKINLPTLKIVKIKQ